MRRALGVVSYAVGVVVLVIGGSLAVQIAGHTALWQVLVLAAVLILLCTALFMMGRRLRR